MKKQSKKIIILKALKAWDVEFSAHYFSHICQYFNAQYDYCIIYEHI